MAGSIPMIIDPGGSATLPLSTLAHSPFHSYLIPGILLFTANGALAFTVLWFVLKRSQHRGLWTVFQGCVLIAWLVAECWLLQIVIWLHYVYGVIGLVLIVCGLIIERRWNPAKAEMRP